MKPIRFSHLKAVGRSPAHGKFAIDNEVDDPTYAMEKGTATHALLFGTSAVVGYHEGRPRRGKDWEAFEAAHPDAVILTASDYERAARMAEQISQHKLAMEVLTGVFEETLLFDFLGRPCRATPDVKAPRYNAELKTTADASPDRFPRHVRKMFYHAQMWLQDFGRRALEHGPAEDNFIVAAESHEPHVVQVYRLGPRFFDEGGRCCRAWMERLIACELANQWPGYLQSVLDIDLEEEFELDFGHQQDMEVVG